METMKKAQFAEFLNLIISILGLIVAFFAIFIIVTFATKNASVEITDAQKIDLAQSYLPLLGMINASEYEELRIIAKNISQEQGTRFFFGDIQTYRTIQRSIVNSAKVPSEDSYYTQKISSHEVLLPLKDRTFSRISPSYLLDVVDDCSKIKPCDSIDCSEYWACEAQRIFTKYYE